MGTELQEIIVYAILAVAVLFALRHCFLRWHKPQPSEGCKDCATPCSLKQEMEANRMFSAKSRGERKKIRQNNCNITKIS